VEQAAAAAEAMQGQAEALMDAVSIFKLASDKTGTQTAAVKSATGPDILRPSSGILAPPGTQRKLPAASADEENDWKEF
jgi:hypothetical protein